MDNKGEFTIYTDGGARGNPGPAAWAVVLKRAGGSDIVAAGALGETTNNIAEYTALVRALELAQTHGGKRLRIHSDSELMVRQMQGTYKVKNAGLLPLYRRATDLVDAFEHVSFQHVRREENKRADRLCNQVLDGDRISDSDGDPSSLALRVGIADTTLPTRSACEDEPPPPSFANPALDPDLTRLVRAWPYLSVSTRADMLKLLDDSP